MSNWEKTMKEWDAIIPDGIKFLSAENRALTRKVRELESENDALQARAERAEAMVERLMRMVEDRFVLLGNSLDGHLQDCNCAVFLSSRMERDAWSELCYETKELTHYFTSGGSGNSGTYIIPCPFNILRSG